jgi:hypothetical protein
MTGNLILDFFDVYGERPNDQADIFLKHRVLVSQARRIPGCRMSRPLRIPDLDSTQGGVYSVQVFPRRYRPVGRFIQILEGKTVRCSLIFPVDPDKVERVEFPDYDRLGDDLKGVLERSDIEGYEQKRGRELYDALDDLRRAGLLNIYTKMRYTTFRNGRSVFSYVRSLRRVRGDRFFGYVEKELRDEVKNSLSDGLFHEVSGLLHTPPPGFERSGSFKTQDRYGNLQLTFFCKPTTLEFIADCDLDDAQGIGHLFQVIGHAVSGGQTHPYDVHEILIHHQRVDPLYRFVV